VREHRESQLVPIAVTLRGISDRFHLHHSHNTFYHSLRDAGSVLERKAVQIIPETKTPSVSPSALDEFWYHTIGKAAERVAALVPDVPDEADARRPPVVTWDITPAFDLMRQERFDDALHHVRTRPDAAGNDPDVLLLEATLFAHSGQLSAAEDGCLRLLLLDEFNAGAHYVLALCREHSGQLERAIEHDRVASYLAPEFAMPRLHLGLLAGRTGDHARARRELTHALELLNREEFFRLLLFGGGFNREALIAICRSALKDCGGEAC